MPDNQNQPKEFDAILGGQAPPPIESAVLGGLQGVKHRLTNPALEARIAALSEALNYGEAGLDAVIDALQDTSKRVQRSAARLLRQHGGVRGKQALLKYDPWVFFTTFQDWEVKTFDPQVGISNTASTAYTVQLRADYTQYRLFELDKFKAFVQDPKANQVEALICDGSDGRNRSIDRYVNALVDSSTKFASLKALFVGDTREREYKKSRLEIGDISPLLYAFPKLEVLQVRCSFWPQLHRDPVFGALRHEHLKTLIIETANIDNAAIAQIGAFDLPALEYFEMWFGRSDAHNSNRVIDSLLPLLFNQSSPQLSYLGLRSSEYADELARAVVGSPIIERLAVLDLSVGNLTDKGAKALLNCPAINQLHTLNISNNCVSANMIQELSQLNCRIIAHSQEEVTGDGFGESRYWALYE